MQKDEQKYEVFGKLGADTACGLMKSADVTLGTWVTGVGTGTTATLTPDWYYERYFRPWNDYYVYPSSVDNTRKAFNVAKMLQEKKLINIRTIKQFTDLVDEIMKVV